MRFNDAKYSKIALALLAMTGSDTMLAANQADNDTAYSLKSPSHFSQALPVSGHLFKLTSTGTSGTPLSLSLCLNINGKSPISCQNYTTYSGVLTLRTTVPNHTYHYAGIRINTPGYVLIPTTQGLNASADITPVSDSAVAFTPLPPLNNNPVTIGSVQLKIQRAVAVGSTDSPLISYKSLIRIAPEITSYSWNIYEHPDMGTAL